MANRWPYCLPRKMMRIWKDLSSAIRPAFGLSWRNPGKKSNREKGCQVTLFGKLLIKEPRRETRRAEHHLQPALESERRHGHRRLIDGRVPLRPLRGRRSRG